jgi:hypothetical protein
MACNTPPTSYPSLVLHLTEAEDGAVSVGASVPLVINTAIAIGEDRQHLLTAQGIYRSARAALVDLRAARRSAVLDAQEFCFKTRGVLENSLGHEWSEAWVATGWMLTLAIPQSFEGIYELAVTLVTYFTANPTKQNEELGVTIAAAQDVEASLRTANQALNHGEAVSDDKKIVRDDKFKAGRKRLSSLCKELSIRLDDMDPRWRDFGLNKPGATTVPSIPENVVVTPLPASRLQIACGASTNATSYRFYVQRPILDPEPIPLGSSPAPLFVTEALTPGQVYLVYVSASNEGAESELSNAVSATPVLAQAA